jgi:predicted transposase/invertase (TIGR01784 family)
MAEEIETEIKGDEAETQVFMSAKSDIIFKLFFGNELNKVFLIAFLQSVLDLDMEEYAEIRIVDPQSKRKRKKDKLTVLDVKLITKTGKIIDIEIQLEISSETRNRMVFYNAKMLSEQLESGKNYADIKKTISIIISGETLLKEHDKYHDKFTLYSRLTNTEFTDAIEIHTLELSKLPELPDGSFLRDWLDFINADTKEDLMNLTKRNPAMSGAVNKLIELNRDPAARALYEAREKQRRDIAALNKDAKEEGKREGKQEGLIEGKREGLIEGERKGLIEGERKGLIEGERKGLIEVARKMLEKNKSVSEITDITGLSSEEINKIK